MWTLKCSLWLESGWSTSQAVLGRPGDGDPDIQCGKSGIGHCSNQCSSVAAALKTVCEERTARNFSLYMILR